MAHSFDVASFLAAHRSPSWLSALVIAIALAVALVLGVLAALGRGGYRGRRALTTESLRSGMQHLSARSAPASTLPVPGVRESDLSRSAVSSKNVATQSTGQTPVTSDPRQYAIAYATALFSYDTRTQDERAWTAVLTGGLDTSADVWAVNSQDLVNRTPPAAVWQTMTSSKQYATFAVTRAWVPELWMKYASQYPAGAAAVSVSGTQDVVWAGGSSEVPQAVTLLLLCPPYNDVCLVNRIAAQVLR